MKNALLLGRTFFARFFETDLMPPGLPQVQLVTGALTILAAPGLLLPIRFASKYEWIRRNTEALQHALLADRLLFVTLMMVGLGFVALVVWDGVFPDRRDARVLGVLPVRGATLIVARLGALGALGLLFTLGMNAVPTFTYGFIVAAYGGAASLFHGMAAHLVATTCAGAFVFFGLIALQGVLLNVAGRRVAEKLSVVLQVGFVVGLLQLVFFFPRLQRAFGHELSELTTHPVLQYVPSVWFLALYEAVGGRGSPDASRLAIVGVLATALVTIAAVALFAATHGRLARLALESRETTGRSNRLIRGISHVVDTILIRRTTERAIFQFTVRTLPRSRTHRMLLALYLGIALAMAASALIPMIIRNGIDVLSLPTIPLLSTPFVILFFVLIGMRVLFALPVEPKANWAIRMLEPVDRKAAMNGARDAMLLGAVVPVCALAASTSFVLLDPWIALVHTIVVFLLGWVLAELLVMTMTKLPFTCTYYPGLSKFRTLWPLYLTAFMNYCYTTPVLESMAFENPRVLLLYIGLAAAAVVGIWIERARRLRALTGFRFQEEDPDAMFQGFNLSEGLAAQAGVRPRETGV